MLRLLIFVVSMLATRRPGGMAGSGRLPLRDRDPRGSGKRDFGTREFGTREFGTQEFGTQEFGTQEFGTQGFSTRERERDAREREAWDEDRWEDDRWEDDTREGGRWYARPGYPAPLERPQRQVIRGRLVRPSRRRRRIPRKLAWGAVLVLLALIFRKVIAWAVLAALSAALHLVGLNVRLPHVTIGWPWQSVTAGTTTDVSVGPWVLQKIEGISRPALGTENFNFTFTHKVSKSIGIWPCWYASTFATTGHASATVDLNPGPAWWAPGTGHYRLQVLSRPATGVPGRVSVAIVLPQPQLPQSVHDVTVDNTMSHPVDTQHSWTYPGLGCGALIRPQFSVSVLYAQAQNLAFNQTRNNPKVTGPLIKAAEAQAAQIVRNNFVQPTVNALGYTLAGFTMTWAATS